MEDKILEILKDVLDINNIEKSINQKDCDSWDSLRHLNLVIALESSFNVSFEPEEIAEMKSFELIYKILLSK